MDMSVPSDVHPPQSADRLHTQRFAFPQHVRSGRFDYDCNKWPRSTRRRLRLRHIEREDVAHAPLGPDYAGRARVALQLAAQAEDLDVNAAVEHVLMDMGRLQEVLPAQGPLRRVQESQQQRILALGEGDGAAIGAG